MHHGTCVTHVLWCMPGSLTSGFLWNRRWGKTFRAFPAHAQPAILRIWQEAHGGYWQSLSTCNSSWIVFFKIWIHQKNCEWWKLLLITSTPDLPWKGCKAQFSVQTVRENSTKWTISVSVFMEIVSLSVAQLCVQQQLMPYVICHVYCCDNPTTRAGLRTTRIQLGLEWFIIQIKNPITTKTPLVATRWYSACAHSK